MSLMVPVLVLADVHDISILRECLTRTTLPDYGRVASYNGLLEGLFSGNIHFKYHEFCKIILPALEIATMSSSSFKTESTFSASLVDKVYSTNLQDFDQYTLSSFLYLLMGNPILANTFYPREYVARGHLYNHKSEKELYPLNVPISSFQLSTSPVLSAAQKVAKDRGGVGIWDIGRHRYTTLKSTDVGHQSFQGVEFRDEPIHKHTKTTRGRLYRYARYEKSAETRLSKSGNRIPPAVGSLREKRDDRFDPTTTMLFEHLNEICRHKHTLYQRSVIYSLYVLGSMYTPIRECFTYKFTQENTESKYGIVLIPDQWLEDALMELGTLNSNSSTEDVESCLTAVLNEIFGLTKTPSLSQTVRINMNPFWGFRVRDKNFEIGYEPVLIEGCRGASYIHYRPNSPLVISIERGDIFYENPLDANLTEGGISEVADGSRRFRHGAATSSAEYGRDLGFFFENNRDALAEEDEQASISSPRGLLEKALNAICDNHEEFYIKHLAGVKFGANLLRSIDEINARAINRCYVYYARRVTVEVYGLNPLLYGDHIGFAVVHYTDGIRNLSRLFYF